MLGVVAAGAAYILGATSANGPVAIGSMVVAIAGTVAGALLMGAERDVRARRARALSAALVAGVILIAFGFAFLAPAMAGPTGVLWLGLPPAAGLVVYGVGVLPLLALPLVYAAGFTNPAPSAPAESPVDERSS